MSVDEEDVNWEEDEIVLDDAEDDDDLEIEIEVKGGSRLADGPAKKKQKKVTQTFTVDERKTAALRHQSFLKRESRALLEQSRVCNDEEMLAIALSVSLSLIKHRPG